MRNCLILDELRRRSYNNSCISNYNFWLTLKLYTTHNTFGKIYVIEWINRVDETFYPNNKGEMSSLLVRNRFNSLRRFNCCNHSPSLSGLKVSGKRNCFTYSSLHSPRTMQTLTKIILGVEMFIRRSVLLVVKYTGSLD